MTIDTTKLRELAQNATPGAVVFKMAGRAMRGDYWEAAP